MGVTDYIMLIIGENLICYDSPNRQIKVLANFSRYTLVLSGNELHVSLHASHARMYIVEKILVLYGLYDH